MKLRYVVTTLRKKVGKNYAYRRHKSSVSNGGGGGRMVENENRALSFEFTNVAEIEFKTC